MRLFCLSSLSVLGMEAAGKVKLRCENIELAFGGLRALSDVSMELREGEILAIIGPNGSGKTCLLNCISGFYRAQKGQIYYGEREISKLAPHTIATLGIARTFQNLQIYTGATALDNIISGRHYLIKYGLWESFLYWGRCQNEEVEHRRLVEDIIDFLELEYARYKPAGALPYGTRKRVELGRALAMAPKVLLLDEPMAGMNLEEKEDMARFVLDISEAKWTTVLKEVPTIIIVEHDMGVVMGICDRIIVLDWGRKIAEGTPAEIKVNPEVIKAYLGAEE